MDEERQRQVAAAAAAAQNGGDPQAPDVAQPPTTYPGTGTVQLPPIGYQPGRYAGPPSGGMPQQMPEYNYPSYSPTSPYGPQNPQMYNPRKWKPALSVCAPTPLTDLGVLRQRRAAPKSLNGSG